MWCIIYGKVSTWDILCKHFFYGPCWYSLSKAKDELITHIFLMCPFGQQIWSHYQSIETSISSWTGIYIEDAWKHWLSVPSSHKYRALPLIICWGIWLSHNREIFKDVASSPKFVTVEAMALLSHFLQEKYARRVRVIEAQNLGLSLPGAYFDGASNDSGDHCGCGFSLYMSATHYFHVSMGFGPVSKSFPNYYIFAFFSLFSLNSGF